MMMNLIDRKCNKGFKMETANLIKGIVKEYLEKSNEIEKYSKTITPDRIDELVKNKEPKNEIEKKYISEFLNLEILKNKIGNTIRVNNPKVLLEEYTRTRLVKETKLDYTYGIFLSINTKSQRV